MARDHGERYEGAHTGGFGRGGVENGERGKASCWSWRGWRWSREVWEEVRSLTVERQLRLQILGRFSVCVCAREVKVNGSFSCYVLADGGLSRESEGVC